MDLFKVVAFLKVNMIQHLNTQLDSGTGITLLWYENLEGDDGMPDELELKEQKVTLDDFVNNEITLEGSFQAGIPGGAVIYTRENLIAEVAKRDVRGYLIDIGFDAGQVTKAWYSKK